MKIQYQGKDITDMVQVNECTIRDTVAGRCDSLELEFGNAAGWYRWGPKEDDEVVVKHNGYSTGIMYVSRITPGDDTYTITATSLPCRARKTFSKSYSEKTIDEIMKICAASVNMEYRIYGIDKTAVIPYIEQENEGCAGFLNRLLEMEGAVLKCIDGRLTAIGILYAQELPALQTIKLKPDQEGIQYKKGSNVHRALTVKTPYAEATAEDTSVPANGKKLTVNLPAKTAIQAGRWARGKLLCMNRKAESVDIESEFNAGFTAMARVNIKGGTDSAGEWLVEEVEHNLFKMTSSATLRRCLWTIK